MVLSLCRSSSDVSADVDQRDRQTEVRTPDCFVTFTAFCADRMIIS